MKMNLRTLLLLVAVLLIGTSNVLALDLGTNITIPDLGTKTHPQGWWGAQEDQEVEPDCEAGQKWDLEGMFMNGTILSLVGGYDFVNGQTGNGLLFAPGDIFIDINGDAKYGPVNSNTGGGYANVNNAFGYDYVLDLDMANGLYNVVKLDSASTVKVYYSQNAESNPWKYNAGGSVVASGLGFDYVTGYTDNQVGFLGGLHNVLSVDLSFLAGVAMNEIIFHYTYGCGNDNLMGKGSMPVPEPATMALLGLSTLGLAAFRRKK
jgi:hypothetical protein